MWFSSRFDKSIKHLSHSWSDFHSMFCSILRRHCSLAASEGHSTEPRSTSSSLYLRKLILLLFEWSMQTYIINHNTVTKLKFKVKLLPLTLSGFISNRGHLHIRKATYPHPVCVSICPCRFLCLLKPFPQISHQYEIFIGPALLRPDFLASKATGFVVDTYDPWAATEVWLGKPAPIWSEVDCTGAFVLTVGFHGKIWA